LVVTFVAASVNDAPSRLLRPITGAGGERLERRAAHCTCAAKSLPLLILFFAAQSAHGEIFKCTTTKAMPTYQNFPCEFKSLGAMPATAPPAKTSADTAANAVRSPMPARPVATMPRVGMTTNEVKTIWGEPLDMSREEYAKGNIETWTYANSRSIRFDLQGRVTEIKW
jgi:hypothetical protein